MQSTNSSIDVNSSSQQIESQISAIKSYRDTVEAEKKIRREAKNSFAKSTEQTASQLNKVSEQQKRFQRNVPSSTDELFKLLGLTSSSGNVEARTIRNLLLRAARKSEQEVQTIIQEEALKALGCSQEQVYNGVSPTQAQNMDSLPVSQAIYIPIQSLDAITLASGLLKQNIESPIGKILYETTGATTSNLSLFKNYGGKAPFPMNRTLYSLSQSNNSFDQLYNVLYRGSSGQPLFNIKYTTVNEFGVTGNYFKVAMVNRAGDQVGVLTSFSENKIGQWLFDYYSTIKLFDTTNLTAQIMNMKIPAPSGQITEQSKFYTILQRILGLCFDQKTEIDVSGTAKIAELDGVDNSFFEFTEVDLRNIDLNLTNIQNGVMEFVDCNNVKVPVDYNNLTNQLVDFRNQISSQTEEQQIATMEKIIDSLSQNPNWKIYIPASFNADASISKNIIKNLAIAVASAALSPKVLLPIFILLKITENSYNLSYNQTITSNTTINQLGIAASNIITNSVEFIRKFKNFMIQVVSRIGAIFIRNLFELLKKELLNIVTSLALDILRQQRSKYYKQTLRLIAIAANLTKAAFFDYRKCQSLLDEIKNILTLLQAPTNPGPPPGKRKKINLALALLSDFLPGESPQRAFLNTIQYLQEAGIPTQALPNGQPNLMLIYNLATHKGRSDEQAENGVNDCYTPTGPCYSLPR
jgi:hypothetical protein